MNSVQSETPQESVYKSAVENWRNDFAGSRKIESPRVARFRYGYLCRLIDDRELAGLPQHLRTRTRSAHKASYWKSLSLLRRDAETILKVRRQKMAAEKKWDFESLVGDYARIQMLLGKLTLAGYGHSLHLGAGFEAAQQACAEFEAFLSSAALARPVLSPTGL
jgi:hypothetical protein